MKRPWQLHRFDCMCAKCEARDAPEEPKQQDEDEEDSRIDRLIEARMDKQFGGGPREGEGEVDW